MPGDAPLLGVPKLIVTPTGLLDTSDRAAIVVLCMAAFGRDFAHLFDLVPPTTMHVRAFLDDQLAGRAC